jgi:hypothetical protein
MLSNDQWIKACYAIESACSDFLSGSKGDDVRDLWDAIHIAENLLDQIRDPDNSDIDDDDDNLDELREIIANVLGDDE